MPRISSRALSKVAGVLLAVAGIVWMALLTRQPTISYEYPKTTFRCTSVVVYDHGGKGQGVIVSRTAPVRIVSGAAVLDDDFSDTSWIDLGDIDTSKTEADLMDDPGVLVSSIGELTAACAAVRVERLALMWRPGVLTAAGLVLLIAPVGSAGRRTAAAGPA